MSDKPSVVSFTADSSTVQGGRVCTTSWPPTATGQASPCTQPVTNTFASRSQVTHAAPERLRRSEEQASALGKGCTSRLEQPIGHDLPAPVVSLRR
jgi:hypothetical protein